MIDTKKQIEVDMDFSDSFDLCVDSFGPLNTLRNIGRHMERDDWQRIEIAKDIRTMRKIRAQLKDQHYRAFYPKTLWRKSHNKISPPTGQ